MDQTAFTLTSPSFLLLPLILIIVMQILSSISSKRRPLPPGPRQWPILGNILQVGKNPHISMANYAKVHGPLISLRLGTRVVVVASSPTAAAEILKTHDRLLSGRYIPATTPYEDNVLDRIALVWNPSCSDQWKFLRAMCRSELFSAKAIESQATLREKKLTEMLDFLTSKQGQIVNIGEVVFTTAFNTISNLLFSKDLLSFEDQGNAGELKTLISTLMELATCPNIADFYPVLTKLDPQGIKRKMKNCLERMFGVWDIYIKERRERHVKDARKTDFLDVFLSNGFDDHQINWLLLELFSAGADTTTTTVEWAMAELLKEITVLEKVREELETEIGKDMIRESHIPQLKYLNACVKETLRLHPPVPFLIPRRAPEACEVMNYTIPKHSQIIVNVWAIGRDPSAWEDPLSYRPERFLDSNLDFKGHNFEFLPFGSGRRICPGLPMGTRQLPLILASLVHCFDWSLQNGDDPAMLDMNDKFSITLEKEQHLLVVPKRKL
ncbi:probable (S)-N-methylcoclaurine 3'-hydroxylase isozyme 2 [Ricinus communis]|uniref:(S)-N-methylcoclaurine 3'-hydroxylase isozyme, putative n=1 Tax=Ricinus communis TaxID=3988 RepID=B9RHX8_RICCO|nr:probable (S)-N-methylcoclaurine 3'-hydroxylase isozyme 2 [Ricinus communis]EEF48750.1 (S)-N-methylcoclaurine 3'-hydroxylase isozyme, putative [Ricinus communis]|eukprot:XP_002513347.1 probable (S)-N-methylcoclaurine 3'-hydroxylase isozyme 2 [Ricinus communis]